MSTCHSYDIYYKFRYSCSGCGQTFGRHTKSIDLTRQCCARCKGRLRLLGAFDRDGIEIKARAPTGFASFVKERFGALKQERPRLSHGELMAELGKQWKEAKAAGGGAAGGGAAGGGAAGGGESGGNAAGGGVAGGGAMGGNLADAFESALRLG